MHEGTVRRSRQQKKLADLLPNVKANKSIGSCKVTLKVKVGKTNNRNGAG